MSAVLDHLPRGNTLSDEVWRRRHRLLRVVLALHVPALLVLGLWLGVGIQDIAEALALPVACLALGSVLPGRRPASVFVALGLVSCSAALVGLSGGATEAHLHFFVTIGFVALYQDWVPFLAHVLATVLGHGAAAGVVPDRLFGHDAARQSPWLWSVIHVLAVLAAYAGVVLFWKASEDEQRRSLRLTEELSAADRGRRRSTADLLVNLARRNQNLLHRQLGLLNRLEERERDPDALSDLFRLDHLATRIRRNADSLLVLSGEETPRPWSGPVPLVDVVRAAIAEIEDLDRADVAVDEGVAVSGPVVADLGHLLAELLENAARFSQPGVSVMVRTRPRAGALALTVEDWGVGMTSGELAEANQLLALPREVDLSVSPRLGLAVVGRLATRHGMQVTLTPTAGGGVTAVVLLPATLLAEAPERDRPLTPVRAGSPTGPVATLDAPVAPRYVADRIPTAWTTTPPPPPRTRVPFAPAPAAAAHPTPPPPPAPVGPPALSAPVAPPAPSAPVAPPASPGSPGPPVPAGSPAAEGPGGLPRRMPGRAAEQLDRPFGGARRDADPEGWSAWWTPHAAPTGPTRPAAEVPADGGEGSGVDGAGSSTVDPPPLRAVPPLPAEERIPLSQRVPQATLAAGLRRETQPEPEPPAPDPPAPVRDPAVARDALSRFQASQRQAREAVRRGEVPDDPRT